MTNEKKFLSTSEYAEAIGVHVQTLRKWDNDGILKAHHITPKGHRQYSPEQVKDYFDGKYTK